MKRIYSGIMVMATLWVVMSFSAPQDGGGLTIHFNHYLGSKQLVLDTVVYTNSLGQSFTVTKFKYYVGDLALVRADGSEVLLTNYYLINEEEPDTRHIDWPQLPAGEYRSMHFIVGVDSAHNCTGLQSGALDPVNAMFWTWNTGYIFLKLEGKAQASTSPGHIFEYHIGGFRAPANCIRTINIPFPKPLVIEAGGHNTLQLKADILEILKTPATIDFAKLSSVTDAHNAPMVADNYVDMFSVLDNAK